MTSAPDLEARVTRLFEAQANALLVPPASWEAVATVEAPAARGRPRRRVAVAVAFAIPLVAVAILAAVVATGPERVTTHGPPAGPPSGGPDRPAIHLETKQVVLDADAITIDVDGKRFTTEPPIDVHGDPGTWNQTTTLELSWRQHGVGMRLNAYFTSDGRDWWSNEIRTYDGSHGGEWLYYTGEFFRTPLGAAFSGDLDVTASDHGVTGRLRIPNLKLEAFRRPPACITRTSQFALQPGTDEVEVSSEAGAAYGLGVTVLDTSTCAPVGDPGRFRYTWRIENEQVASVTADGPSAIVEGHQSGETALHVTAADPNTGEPVAGSEIAVLVRPREGTP